MPIDFRKLNVWKKSFNFALEIYKLTDKFPESEKSNIISQLRRASVSISTNIAEGCGKESTREISTYFRIALASTKECLSLLMLSKELKYLEEKEYEDIFDKADHVAAMIHNMIKSYSKLKFNKKFKNS